MNRVRLALTFSQLRRMRRWLVSNCGRRWQASDYKNQPWNWRMIGKMPEENHPDEFEVTTWVDFNEREDMMLFLLVWPGEVAIYDSIEPASQQENDKYPCYTKVTQNQA